MSASRSPGHRAGLFVFRDHSSGVWAERRGLLTKLSQSAINALLAHYPRSVVRHLCVAEDFLDAVQPDSLGSWHSDIMQSDGKLPYHPDSN